jgi:hypothetical protein
VTRERKYRERSRSAVSHNRLPWLSSQFTEPAADERYARSSPGLCRWMRRSFLVLDFLNDAWRHRPAWPEHLGTNLSRFHAPGGQAGAGVAHERVRPAHVEVGVARDALRADDVDAQASLEIEVEPATVRWERTTVSHAAPTIGQPADEIVNLASEWMLCTVARAMDPPHWPRRDFIGKCMKHREERSDADAGTEQHYRTGPGSQNARTSRCCHIDDIPRSSVFMQVGSRGTVGFLLHAYSIPRPSR